MQKHTFTLTPAADSDRSYLERLFFLTDVWGDEHKPVSDSFASDIVTYIDNWSPAQGGFIARAEDRVLAGGVWMRHGTPESRGTGFIAPEIPELAIAIEQRYSGHGLGTLLIEAVVEQARSLGAPAISLAVDHGNDRAKALYEKLGFHFVRVSDGGTCDIFQYDIN